MTVPATSMLPPIVPPESASAAAAAASSDLAPLTASAVELLNSHAVIFTVSFLAALLATPLVRRLAVRYEIIDHPDQVRKHHAYPVAYLGGVAVFIGLVAGIAASLFFVDTPNGGYTSVPLAVVIGMVAIAITGMIDDIWKIDPRLKIAGQLIAAAGLAIQDVGVRVAGGLLSPIAPYIDSWFGSDNMVFVLPITSPLTGASLELDVIYWAGTAIVAVFVLGACNASNLIDGLDGLLSGTTAIVALGLLIISLMMAVTMPPLPGEESMTGARIVLSFALLGAVLGFLPHNFNPAVIFLGDCGSLLLGYMSIVIILMLGENGQTHLVFAGLIIFALPVMDTTLAIIRRKLAGASISAADDQHLHHQLKRSLGGVKKAVFAMYGISAIFAVVGVSLAALVMFTEVRVRIIYSVALLLFSFIGVIAVKAARREKYRIAMAGEATVQPGAAAPPAEARSVEPVRVR